MKNRITITRMKIAKGTIASKDYIERRMNSINSEIQLWRERKHYSNTLSQRDLCDKMCAMYLKRYEWYLGR